VTSARNCAAHVFKTVYTSKVVLGTYSWYVFVPY